MSMVCWLVLGPLRLDGPPPGLANDQGIAGKCVNFQDGAFIVTETLLRSNFLCSSGQ